MKVAVIYNKMEVKASDVLDIFGPQTKERYNPKTVEKVAAALEKGGHNVRVIEGNIDVADELREFMPRVMAGERPGMVFNMAYGIQGQSRYTHIPAMLEMLGVPYVGSGPEAHAVALDKIMTKIILQQHKLPTPQFWFFSSPTEKMDDVIYPVIVKPKMEAVSMGMRIVDNQNDLRDAVKYIIDTFQQQALVERFITGREFAVGLLGNGAELEVLPVVEFDLGDPNAIQIQEEKMKKPIEKISPAAISDELTQEMKRLAREAFQALGIYDFARIDLRMDTDENLYILELNSMASLGLTGSYVHGAKTAGYTYESLVNRMLDVAATRYFGMEYYQERDEEKMDESQPLRIRLRSYVRSNLTTMADYLDKMTKIHSYVFNTEGVNSLGNWISGRLKQLGFNRQVHPQAEVGNILFFTNHDSEENDILLLGHLDTVYNYQDFVPFREERGRYFGSGVAESKGGLAIMLTALQALRFARRLKKVRCGILLITDDTLGGRYSQKIVSEISFKSKYVVGLKYGGRAGGIVTSCGGRTDYTIEMSNIKDSDMAGTTNIITAISQKIVGWQKLSSSETGIIVNPTFLEARTLYGLAPDYAKVSLDTHFKLIEQGDYLDNEIRKFARRGFDSKLQIRIKKGVHRPPHIETEITHQFFERVQKMATLLETKVASIHRTASSAVCYVPENIPVLEGLGPAGGNSRSPNEYILRDSLIDRATLLALIIMESLK
jgi:D-alanine-D-alanine ligase